MIVDGSDQLVTGRHLESKSGTNWFQASYGYYFLLAFKLEFENESVIVAGCDYLEFSG